MHLTEAQNLPSSLTGEIIFLDFQATTPLDPIVLEAMLPWMNGAYNAHATEHLNGRMASEAVDCAREKVATLLGCKSSEITFTSGATESSNIVLRGSTRPGDGIVISALEHASVIETAYALEAAGRTIHQLAVTNDGILELDTLQTALISQPALVSVTAVNSEIGTTQPIEEMADICADEGISLHSDISQAVGRIPITLRNSSVAYASVSSHKIYGPQGVGALYVRNGANTPRPLSTGGGQENGLRPGTLPVANCVGFGVACELALDQRERDCEHVRKLSQIMLDALADLSGWQVNGSLEERIPHNLSIAFEGVDAEILLATLPGLALATGSACNAGSLKESTTLKAIGLSESLAGGTIRIGFGRTTTQDEVRTAAKLLRDQVKMLRNSRV